MRTARWSLIVALWLMAGCTPRDQGNCVDIGKGADYTTFANRGETAGRAVGDACDLPIFPGRFQCATGLCMPDLKGGGFCSKMCTGDSDCGALVCKAYRIKQHSFRSCIPANLEFCNKP